MNHRTRKPTKRKRPASFPGTLRDWFAGQALAALITCPSISGNYVYVPDAAYKYADAMIERRESETKRSR